MRVVTRDRPRRRVRTPVQARARERREALLDATARLLDEGGYDAVTTNAVAREAKTGIGTVYEYFPSREALLEGLLERYRIRLEAVFDAAVAAAPGTWQGAVELVVEAFADFWLREPGYRALWGAVHVSPLLAETGQAWAETFTRRFAALGLEAADQLPPARRRLIARVAVHLVSGLLQVAVQAPARVRRAIVEETKRALVAYLSSHLACL
jgi:AcrR family transcriptional regulator